MGTPPPDLLAKLKKRSNHAANFDFQPSEGTGLAKMLAHVSPDCAGQGPRFVELLDFTSSLLGAIQASIVYSLVCFSSTHTQCMFAGYC